MLSSTEGILLSTIRHTESKLLATFLTEQHGIQTTMVRVSSSKASRATYHSLHPFSIHNMVLSLKPNISNLKEISTAEPLHELRNDVVRSAIAQFIAECLYLYVKEREPNPALYSFVRTAVSMLNQPNMQPNNFHLLVLIKLTGHLGIQPNNNHGDGATYFDVVTGQFLPVPNPAHPMSGEESLVFAEILGTKFVASAVKMTNETRKKLLRMTITYYQIHLHSKLEPKSFGILAAVFEA